MLFSTLSLQSLLTKFGGYLGIAAFFGFALLALIHFAQARELKRLREWAGKAPEREHELEEVRFELAALRRAQVALRSSAFQQSPVGGRPAAQQVKNGTNGAAAGQAAVSNGQAVQPGVPAMAANGQVSPEAVSNGGVEANSGSVSGDPAVNGGASLPTADQPTELHEAVVGSSVSENGVTSGSPDTGKWLVPSSPTTTENVLRENADLAFIREIGGTLSGAKNSQTSGDNQIQVPGTGLPATDGTQRSESQVHTQGADVSQQSQADDSSPSETPEIVMSMPEEEQKQSIPPGFHSRPRTESDTSGSSDSNAGDYAVSGEFAERSDKRAPEVEAREERRQPPARRAAALRASNASKSPKRAVRGSQGRSDKTARGATRPPRSNPRGSRPTDSRGPSTVQKRRKRALWIGGAAVLLIIVGLVASGAFGGGSSNDTKTKAAKSSTAAKKKAISPLQARAQTKVAVLNGTTVSGLAKTISDRLTADGFAPGSTGNHTDQQRAASLVLYRTGSRNQAQDVARLLKITDVAQIDPEIQTLAGKNAKVVVVVGSDHAQ